MADVEPKANAASIEMASAALRGALKAVGSVTERRNTLPILCNLRLSVSGRQMTIHATDLDLWASAVVDLSTPGHLDTTVSAQTLNAIMAEVQGGGAALRLAGGKLHLTAQRAVYDLPTLPAEDWPMPPEPTWAAQFEIAGPDLVALIGAVSYAQSSEETRYYLNGVFLHTSGAKLKAAATDGHRCSVKTMKLPDGAKGMPSVIIPRKTVALILRLADGALSPVTVSVCENRIRVEIDGIRIDSKTIDGTFPDYSRVIPTTNDLVAEVDPVQLLGAIRRVTAIATERTRAIKLTCGPAGIVAEVTSPENGHAREDIPASYAGSPITIGFNSAYLLDIISRASGDTLSIAMADSAAPTLFKDPNRPDLTQVLMPMRV